MTKNLLLLLAASAVAGISVVTLVTERSSPAANRASAPDLPIDTGTGTEPAVPDRMGPQSPAPSASTVEPRPAGMDRRFGEAVIFTVGYVCDDAGNCSYRPAPQHEYARYTRQQLETIAGFDGAAAIILANRLGATDLEAARRWAVQGFLLTGDPYAFHMASVYSGVQVGARFDTNGELDRSAAEEAYIWLKIGHELGVADGSRVNEQARILADYQAFEPERLDAEVDARLEKLIADRVRLTGRTF
jgi:hypothetical protein